MAEKSSDPAAAWRSMLGEWEKSFNSFANKAMEKEDFARAMGAATSAGTSAQGAFSDVMTRYLATLNLPSRADLAGVGERLQAIEAQINHLSTLVQAIAGKDAPQKPSAPKPSRTRKPSAAPKAAPPAKDAGA